MIVLYFSVVMPSNDIYRIMPVVVYIYFNLDVSFDLVDVYMDTFLYTNTLYSLSLIVNTNIGSVVNDEVVVMGITLEYHRSNDGGSYAKILLLLEIERIE